MATTLYLAPNTWDLVADLNGNIAVAKDSYALAQDAASAIKLFLGELYYDTTQGVPWFTVYGQLPPLNYVRSLLERAALTVPGVNQVTIYFSAFNNRQISGQVQINNGAASASFGGVTSLSPLANTPFEIPNGRSIDSGNDYRIISPGNYRVTE